MTISSLPLGTYQFETYEGMPSVQGKTITVKEDSDEIVMNMNVYKLTGNCKINGESADRNTWIDLRRKEDGYYLASYIFIFMYFTGIVKSCTT